MICPSMSDFRQISRYIALEIARNAIVWGVATRFMHEEELASMEACIEKNMWSPKLASTTISCTILN